VSVPLYFSRFKIVLHIRRANLCAANFIRKNLRKKVKYMFKKFFLVIIICLISACSTTHYKGDGVILSEKKINAHDLKPHEVTKAGAIIGGTAGIVTGATMGGAFGLALSALGSLSTAEALVMTLGTGAVGALIVGAAGGAIGGGAGYVIDVASHPVGYQYVIQPSYQSETITITQYTKPIAVNSKVHILEKNQSLFIESTRSPSA
jgi:hypothetical protein